MSRILWKLALFCIVLFTVSILLIDGYGHSSARDSDLRALFVPSNCRIPCFMGLNLGTTTLSAGLKQLQSSASVQSIEPVPADPDSPASSGLYDLEFTDTPGAIQVAQVQFSTATGSTTIDGVDLLDGSIQLKDILASFGPPTSVVLDNPLHDGLVTYVAFYPQFAMYIQIVLAVCSPDLGTFWNTQQNVLVGIDSLSKYRQERSFYSADSDYQDKGWLTQIEAYRGENCL